VISKWCPHIIKKESEELKNEAPGVTKTDSFPAFIKSGSSYPFFGYPPNPRIPFSE